MSSIDTRVVEMQFDNKAFGSGVKQSLTDLDNLKKGLKLEGATSGLDAVSNAVGKFSVGSMVNGIGEAAKSFGALQIAGITAMVNLVNKAVDAGVRIAKALTIEPVKSGLDSYAEQINATQIIMANTKAAGTTLPEITDALANLQTYAQQTVYSFSDMTNNIGKFTAAGVKLQPSVDAIKGMANVAALSGASTEQMSSAMYQVSQALAGGVIHLQDWNSLMQANMAGQGIQEALKETAKSMGDHGKLMEASIKKEGDFRQSLKDGWLTTDVYTKAMSVFGGTMDESTGKFRAFTVEELKAKGYSDAAAKSLQQLSQDALNSAVNIRTIPQLFAALKEEVAGAWSQVFKTVFGDINEATSLFSGIHNTMEAFLTGPVNSLNDTLKGWKLAGGRDTLFAGLKDALTALGDIVNPIKIAFREFFPPKTSADLVNMTKAFADFTKKLIPSGDTIVNLTRTFRGFFAILDIGKQLISAAIHFIGDLIGHFTQGSGGVLKFTANIGDFLANLDKAIKSGDVFNRFFGALEKIIEAPIDKLKQFVGVIASFVGSLHLMDGASAVLGRLKQNFHEMSSFGENASKGFSVIGKVFGAIWKTIEPILSGIGKGLKAAGGAVKDFLSGLSFNDLLGVAATGGILGIALSLKKLVGTIKGLFKGGDKDKKPGFMDKLKESLDSLTDTLKAMQQALKAATILAIAAAILAMAIAVNVLSKIDPARLASSVTAIGFMIGELVGGMKLMDKLLKDSKPVKLALMAASLVLLAIAVDVLASAAKKLASLSWNDLTKGLLGVVVLLGAVAGAMRLMPEQSKMISSGLGIILIAEAIKILVTAVKQIADLSWGDIAKGLTGVATLLLALGLYTKFAGVSSIGDGAGLLLMAAAIKVLASAMKDISSLSWNDIAKGLAGIAGGLISMTAAMKLLPKGNLFNGAAIVVVAAALKILASAMKDMSGLSWEQIGKGLATTAGGLALIVLALKLIPAGNILNAVALVVVTAALKVLASAMADMGKMSWSDIAAALVVLAASLTIIAVALIVMEGSLPGAAALIVAAVGLKFLADSMVTMGAMSWSDIAAALVALSAALVILAVGLTAMMVALPGALALLLAAPGLTAMAAVMALFGAMDWSTIGKAIVAMLGLFAALAVGGVLAPLIGALAIALIGLGAAIALFGAGVALIGAGVKNFADGLTALSNIDSDKLKNLSDALDLLIQKIPEFAAAIAQGMVDFAQTLADGAPAFGVAAAAIIDQIIYVVGTKMPELAAAFAQGTTDSLQALADKMPEFVNAGADLLVNFLEGIANNMGRVAQAGTDVVTSFLAALGADIPQIVTAGFQMIIAVMNGIADSIRQNMPQIKAAAANIGSAIIDGITGGLGDGGGVISKIKGIAGDALQAAKNLLGIHSPSKEFEKVGKFVVEGFALGLTGNKDKIDTAVGDMMGQLDDAMQAELDDIDKHDQKIGDLLGQRQDNANAIVEAQRKLNEAINNPIAKSSAKKAADRNAANAKALQTHNDQVHAAQLALDNLIKKQNDYNQSIQNEYTAINQDGDEYWRMNAAKVKLNELMATEQGHLDDLANQHDDLTQSIKDQTSALDDAIRTRDDYNKSLTDSLDAEAAVTADTNLSDYVANLQQQIVDVQQFTIAIQELRKRGLNDTMYKQLLDAGPSASMPFVQQLLDGGQAAVDNINYLGTTLDQAAGVLGKDASDSLYQAGVDAAAGLLKGLQDQDSAIQQEMQRIANYMVQSLNNALGIHSPSRVMAEIGAYSAQGLANGLSASAGIIGQASEAAGQTAIDSMKKTISGLGALIGENMDVNPTITPVLDLSAIQKDASSINDLLGGQISVGTSSSSARDALVGYTANQNALAEAIAAQQAAPITFVQNNTSPKALSQAEIYRNTNNQLSRAKGALASNAR